MGGLHQGCDMVAAVALMACVSGKPMSLAAANQILLVRRYSQQLNTNPQSDFVLLMKNPRYGKYRGQV
jgi:hypothetical protein